MELGHTIPLQKFLRIQPPPYGTDSRLFFCWELHRITLQSSDTLAAVNGKTIHSIIHPGDVLIIPQ